MSRRRFAGSAAVTGFVGGGSTGQPMLPAGKGASTGELHLQQRLGSTGRAARFYSTQVVDTLTDRMVAFLHEQFMFFLATTDAQGGPDCSVRVGDPGFVVPLTRRTLVYPELRGNGVMASLGNILGNPRLSLLFVDFEKDTIGLHVNGRGREAIDTEIAGYHDASTEPSTMVRRAVTWLAVDLDCAYVHCSKHLPRLVRQPKKIDWSTDSGRSKGGDYFGTAAVHCEDRDW